MLFNELNNQNYQNIITEDPRTWSLFAGLTEGEYTELEQNVSIVHFAKDEGKSYPQEVSFMEKVHKIVDQNLADQEFSISTLLRELHMSRAQLYRKFNALTNQSVNGYIKVLRLKRARHLLENSELNVSEVAYSVGFKDLSHFSRSFTKEYNVKPSDFKHNKAHI